MLIGPLALKSSPVKAGKLFTITLSIVNSFCYKPTILISIGHTPMPNLYYSEALIAFHNNEYDKAQELFLNAIVDDTEHLPSYFFLGKICFLTNEKKQALTYLEQYIELGRNEPHERNNVALAFDLLGQCYDAYNEDDKALDCYLQAIALDSSCASAWHNRGLFFMKIAQKYLENSVSFIVSAKTTSPTSRALGAGSSDVPRLLDPADEPRDVGDRGLAETMNEAENSFDKRCDFLRNAYCFLKKALLLSPQNPMFLHSIASWHEQSIENIEQSANTDPNIQQKIDHHFKLAIAYYRKALAACAEDDVSLKRIVTDNLSECLAQYGHIHYGTENYRAAEDYYLQAVQLEPFHLVALNQLGMCCFKQGDFFNARTYFQTLLKKTNDSQELADAWLNIACTYRFEKSFAKADCALNKAKILSPYDPALKEEEKKLIEAKVFALLTTTSQTWFGARLPSLHTTAATEYLIEMRHEHPLLQHEYDKQFGLTLTP